MELQLNIAGYLLIALSLIHLAFPRYFAWSAELKTLSLINRQMMYVHTFFIAFVVFLAGILCLTSANELITTSLGRKICLGCGIFGGVRLVIQFVGYSSELWKGKRFETYIHLMFSGLWVYLTGLFMSIYIN